MERPGQGFGSQLGPIHGLGLYQGLYRGYIGVILGLYWDNGKENGNYYNGLYRGYIGLYWGYIGIMEKKMETTIMGYIGVI